MFDLGSVQCQLEMCMKEKEIDTTLYFTKMEKNTLNIRLNELERSHVEEPRFWTEVYIH